VLKAQPLWRLAASSRGKTATPAARERITPAILVHGGGTGRTPGSLSSPCRNMLTSLFCRRFGGA
jgi:hypothetical protein